MVDTISIPAVKTPTKGTYVYTNAGGEQTIKEWSDGKSRILCGGWIFPGAMTKDGTLRIYYHDGSNYQKLEETTILAATPVIFLDSMYGLTANFKVTWQESSDEGADRNILFDFLEI